LSILNQKEEVLAVELTKQGRKLLAQGIFQPAYYSFFDDSIIYDNNYAGITTENVNEIKDRIMDNSLTFKALSLSKNILNNPLGKSNPLNDYSPSWDLKVLNGSINYNQDDSTFYKKIFDLADIQYTVKLSKNAESPTIESEYFLLDLQELNLDDDIQNFEIELVTFDDISGGKQAGLERKLYFNSNKTNIIDDLLYEENELPSKFFDIKVSSEDVAYYFDALVDDEIDSDFISSKEKTLQEKVKGTYSSNYAGPVDPKC
jgi:hypothetical protein